MAFSIMRDQRPDARESVAAFVSLSHAVRGLEPLPSATPSISLLSALWEGGGALRLPTFQCSLVWSKTQKVSNNRNLPLPFPFLSPVLHVFLFSLSLSFLKHPIIFFFRFSSSTGMNCKFVKNAVLIPKPFLVRCPLLCSLSVFPPKLRNLALLKTWKCWSTFEAGAPAALAPFQKASIRIPAFLFPSPSNSLTLSLSICAEGRGSLSFLFEEWMNEWEIRPC